MKYKVGDKVRIKSLDWYYKNKGKPRYVTFAYAAEVVFTEEMASFCGQIVTILQKGYTQDIGFYRIREDNGVHMWTDEMIEGLVEKPITLNGKEVFLQLADIKLPSGTINIWECPKGYQFVDENGNIINTTKIVLEKKKKEYPKTYKECCEILGFDEFLYSNTPVNFWYKWKLFHTLNILIVCRDAYWKIAGDEMGLGKPWEPDWNNDEIVKYCIIVDSGITSKQNFRNHQSVLAFPTEEMRDAFYENFGPDIEFCKEFL